MNFYIKQTYWVDHSENLERVEYKAIIFLFLDIFILHNICLSNMDDFSNKKTK